MQTKLRIGGLMFAASLLGVSPISATTPGGATHKAQGNTHNRPARPMGMASWYGKQHQGRKMANGQRFDRQKLTAASWVLPLGSQIRVVNLRNGNSVVVTVTDRGPARRLRRILDLSEAAAAQLGYLDQGLAPVFYSPATYFEAQWSEVATQLEAPVAKGVLVAASRPDRPM